MSKKKIFKAFLALLFTGMASLSITACETTDEEAFTGFLKGYLVDVKLGNTFYIKDYVDVVNDSNYTIVVAKKDGSWSDDMTRSYAWETYYAEPGEYTITYTVHEGANKGV